MAITASITISQLTDPTTFKVTDTTPYAGSDSVANFSGKTLTITKSDGSALAGYSNPINFPVGDTELEITGLTEDLAFRIVLTLVPVVPVDGSVYTTTVDVALNRFLEKGLFDIQVERFLGNRRNMPKCDEDARVSSIDLLIEAENSQSALVYGSLSGSQSALDRAKNIISNTSL